MVVLGDGDEKGPPEAGEEQRRVVMLDQSQIEALLDLEEDEHGFDQGNPKTALDGKQRCATSIVCPDGVTRPTGGKAVTLTLEQVEALIRAVSHGCHGENGDRETAKNDSVSTVKTDHGAAKITHTQVEALVCIGSQVMGRDRYHRELDPKGLDTGEEVDQGNQEAHLGAGGASSATPQDGATAQLKDALTSQQIKALVRAALDGDKKALQHVLKVAVGVEAEEAPPVEPTLLQRGNPRQSSMPGAFAIERSNSGWTGESETDLNSSQSSSDSLDEEAGNSPDLFEAVLVPEEDAETMGSSEDIPQASIVRKPWYTTRIGLYAFAGHVFLIAAALMAGFVCLDGRCKPAHHNYSVGRNPLIRGSITGTPVPVGTASPTALPMPVPSNVSLVPGEMRMLRIEGLFDLQTFPEWPSKILNFTMELINNKTDGWHDDVLPDTVLQGSMHDSACDADIAVGAYLNVSKTVDDPFAIVGCRCSGATMAVARLSGIENIPILSPSASSAKLSSTIGYPTFSRMMAADNEAGLVGATVSLIRAFGWNRISIINTDTQYASDHSIQLSNAWRGEHGGDDPFVGEIAFTDTIELNSSSGQVDQSSVRRVLSFVPTDKSKVNSRVIVLIAHHDHAFAILKTATEMKFQPDTIWIGASAWIEGKSDTSWMPEVPGYIGLTPHRNFESPVYKDFLARLRQYEAEQPLQQTESLDHRAELLVDGIITLAKAFTAVPADQRRNGVHVSKELRRVSFDGVSGPVAFHENGDFLNPSFTVKTLSSRSTQWTDVGLVTPNSAFVDFSKICYAQVGCVSSIPGDAYDLAPPLAWVWVVIGLLLVLSMLSFLQMTMRIRDQKALVHQV
ncbi:Glutamate receptor, metabotropic 8 [Seminavis robusta]|uniref:Glutamate receptor, metabotropic 8 n=1 Tax=Seminavis robusta TaxID=568900 RepID=A0A9N8H845_9STRA|nr:Glutamate receptor, metabotropic 8 [Seminavis robusta]|eukprot:Sro227_g092140.1 Glutamate receptor, metabotropic 8 (849) ;mRNA; f:5053-7599